MTDSERPSAAAVEIRTFPGQISVENVFQVHLGVPEFVESGAPPRTITELRQRFQGKTDVLLLVGQVEATPAGYLLAYNDQKYGEDAIYLDLAGVKPAYRKHGVLRAMEEYLEEWTKTHGYKTIEVKTWKMRREMQKALIKLGFKLYREQPKENPEETRLYYKKEL